MNLMNTRLAKLKEKITAQRKHLDELENHMYVSLYRSSRSLRLPVMLS